MSPSQDSVSSSQQDEHATSIAGRIGLFLGPLWLIATLVLPAPGGMDAAAWHCAGLALFMATWWATEAIPIPATSLLPLAVGTRLAGFISLWVSNTAAAILMLPIGIATVSLMAKGRDDNPSPEVERHATRLPCMLIRAFW